MPELPEVESARVVIERQALGRRIVVIEDVDDYVCRPYRGQDFQRALIGCTFRAACRRGKQLWLETAPAADNDAVLGLHLGMGGRIVVTDSSGDVVAGGDSTHGLAGPYRHGWDRLSVQFEDGRALRMVDKRRLARAVLNPDLARLGPDASAVALDEFRIRLGRSTAPIKARLLDQAVVAGVGNLVADETLWRARIDPSRPTVDLTPAETGALHRSMRSALRYALRHGGSHTGHVIQARRADGRCPRCDAPMAYARVGGRATWSCSVEQRKALD